MDTEMTKTSKKFEELASVTSWDLEHDTTIDGEFLFSISHDGIFRVDVISDYFPLSGDVCIYQYAIVSKRSNLLLKFIHEGDAALSPSFNNKTGVMWVW